MTGNGNRRRVNRLVIALLAVLLGCQADAPTSTEQQQSAAALHLDELIDIMQTHSIKRRTIDWRAFRAAVHAKAAGATQIEQAYPAIEEALRRIGDGHSSYRAAVTGRFIFVRTRSCNVSDTTTPVLPSRIGYVRVSAFSGSGAAAVAFADSIVDDIRTGDAADLVGWIVDLRGNGGGNMWPMLAGIGPILGEGLVGWFIDPDDEKIAWSYEHGRALYSGSPIQQVSSPYRLHRERPRVAVLTDNRVASSGEAIAIAFRARPNTRSFGVATCGLSTANRSFPLSNGATLVLTVSTMADRTQTMYGDQVVPDEVIPGAAQAVLRAVEWLQSAGAE